MKYSDVEERVTCEPPPSWVLPTEWHPSNPCESSLSETLHQEKQVHALLKVRFYRTVRRFNKQASIQLGSVLDFDFYPSYQSIQLHSVKIVRNGVEIEKLPQITTRLTQREAAACSYIYTGVWTLSIIIDDVREGDILDYSYSIHGQSACLGDYMQDYFVLSSTQAAKKVFCRLIAPVDISLKSNGKEVAPIANVLENNLGEWVWDIVDSEAVKNEPLAPNWYEPSTWVQISSFQNWHDVAEQGKSLFVPPILLSSEITEQLSSWKKNSHDSKELIKTIVRFVQNDIRYLSLGDGVGAYKAADPNVVFSRRYGDCKDKSWLLCLMLREVGVTAYPALVSTHWEATVDSLLPTLLAFNHAIVSVEYEDSTYWIDSTRSSQGGRLEAMTPATYGCALVIGKPETALVNLKHIQTQDKVTTSTAMDITDPKSVSFQVSTTFEREGADNFRNYCSYHTSEELEREFFNAFKTYYTDATVIEPFGLTDDLEENIIRTRENYNVTELGVLTEDGWGHSYTITPTSFNGIMLSKSDLDRTTPLDLPYPRERIEEFLVKLPCMLASPPESRHFRNEYVEYSEEYLKNDYETYRFIFRLKWLKDHLPVEDLPKMHAFVDFIKNSGQTLTVPVARKALTDENDYWARIGISIFALMVALPRLFVRVLDFFR
ncbi:DUF3857 domain-containing protein [Undibacterium sp.]|uniref:DUF3857 domain-containing transglutaminase family protein n=1 Tax=Undibacterium sp. TaxID=1914977 RepID=UPI00273067AC|nr:DUF3857 domain-containing protein [Undibacterium sp.]MDP1978687.1 DUF3857 domain-containing protein [Undibacterium sp.]